MLKHLFRLICLGCFASSAHAATDKTAHDFAFTAIDGTPMPLDAYRGKVLLMVNTASECGFTPQYEGLEKLYQTYKDQGLVIIGVPSNDFGGQEPGSNEEIAGFCEKRFHITFPMAAKSVVKGEGRAAFYAWAEDVLGSSATPSWNFHKYLIGRDGKLVDFYSSTTGPSSSSLKEKIETALAKK